MLNAFERMDRLQACRACPDYPQCPDSQRLIEETVGCPNNRWPLRGAGDVVALAAQPIARAVDSILGTKIGQCAGCKSRRETLNRILPLR